MTIITEGTLQFNFASGWDAIKFDETEAHKKKFGHSNAMDILVHNSNKHWWIEIKDCKGHERENRPRLEPKKPEQLERAEKLIKDNELEDYISVKRSQPFLVDEIIEKLRDTLITLYVAKRNRDLELADFSSWFDNHELVLTVILFLTWKDDDRDFKNLAKRLQEKLNNALIPYKLKARGFVVNEETFSKIIPSCTISRINPPTK